jgi:hypothetical protein
MAFSEYVTGFDQTDVAYSGCEVLSFIESVPGRNYTISVRYTSTRIELQIPAGVVTDAAGNTNAASDVHLKTFSGHYVPGGVNVAENQVPWGGALCLTQDDLVKVRVRPSVEAAGHFPFATVLRMTDSPRSREISTRVGVDSALRNML